MEAKIKCHRCGNMVGLQYVRYDKNGRDLICFDCYLKQHPEARSTSFRELHIVDINPRKKGESKKYMCSSCGYKFYLKKGTPAAKRCPYCGSESVEEFVPVMADDLL